MRLPIATLCGLFLASTLVGCGGAAIPTPPENSKPGPPPGTSDDMMKLQEKAAKKK